VLVHAKLADAYSAGILKEIQLNRVKQVSWLSHRLRNNIGRHDRFLRSLLGAALVLVAWLFLMPEAFWLGMFLIVTAAFRFCPNYVFFNFDTLNAEDQKTVIPWQEFLDLFPPVPQAPTPAPKQSALVSAPDVKETPVVAKARFSLPPELTHALIQDIEKNALDEVLLVRFYENFFGCKISIRSAAHLNVYVCQFPDKEKRLDFAHLKSTLLDRLRETVV
jgi:hypothetical protein